jgi:hypothetical protein
MMIKSVDAQNAACNAIVQLIDQGSLNPTGSLSLVSTDSNVIANFMLSYPAFAPAIDGTSVSNPITDSSSLIDGTASTFDILDRDSSVVWSGTVTDFAGTGDLKLNSIIIPYNVDISLTQIVYSVPDSFVNIGIQGNTGVQGIGYTGVQGLTGVQGQTGLQGNQGFTGVIGLVGLQGQTGVDGQTGLQGITGPLGGPQGDTGLQGITGPTGGDQGQTGLQGPTGVQGIDGNQGITGVQGINGVTGVKGDLGQTGLQGLTGPLGGPAGATGVGFQGTTGLQGLTGVQGQTGLQGPISSSIDFNQVSRYEVVSSSGAEVWVVSSSTVFNDLVWSRSTTTLTIYRTGNSHTIGNTVIVRNTNLSYQVGLITFVDAASFTINTLDTGSTSGISGAYSLGFTYTQNGGTGGTLYAPTGDYADVQLLSMRIRTGLRSGGVYDLVVPSSAICGAGEDTSSSNCYVPDFNVRNDDLSVLPSNLAPIGATITTNLAGSYSTFEFGNLGIGNTSRVISLHF